MKGTFFSADFVRDENDDLRLIEINTDTGIIESQKDVFDWTEFFGVLSQNNITELDVLYKDSVQKPIIDSLTSSIATGATFIKTYNPILIPEESIFPNTPADAENKFILRMAYDETAILDSEYAKGTLNLLKLFVDNGDSGSVVNFYHSSSLYGNYNTLDMSLPNPQNVPDIISKTLIEEHIAHTFYKIGRTDMSPIKRIEGFIEQNQASDLIFQQYHYSPDSIVSNDNHVSSVRTFHIVYGSDLDLCTVAEYEIMSIFELPTTLDYNDEMITNINSNKHYYEFATNHIKNLRHGFLGDTKILNTDGVGIEMQNVTIGDTFESYFIEGAPNTDNYNELADWESNGSTLPSGSYQTTSSLVDIYTDETYTNEMSIITFNNDDEIILGGETRLLVYDNRADLIKYIRVLDLNDNDELIKSDGGLAPIKKIETAIFENPQNVYALNLEDVDNFILEVQNLNGFSIGAFFGIAHNCFVAGTKVHMEDGSEKNIEDVIVGDSVISFNERTKEKEIKKVIDLRKSTNDNLVKYTLSNGTEITSTYEHPYYVDGKDLASYIPHNSKAVHDLYNEANQIYIGDKLYTFDGGIVEITSIDEINIEQTDVFIFTVEDNHNFYANNILVHNK